MSDEMHERRRFCSNLSGKRVRWRRAIDRAITTGSSASMPCGASPSVPAMNKYGHMAMRHWSQVDPARVAQIPDNAREAFFAQLGERAESEIQQLQDRLAGPDPPNETYLEKVGRLNMARLQAEEIVLPELILIAGSPAEEDENLEWASDPEGRTLAAEHREYLQYRRELQALGDEESET